MHTKIFLAALTSSAIAVSAEAQVSLIQNGTPQPREIPRVLPEAQPRNPTLMCADLEISFRSEPRGAETRALHITLTNVGTRAFRSEPGLQYISVEFRQDANNSFDADFPFTSVEVDEVIEFTIEYDNKPQAHARAQIVFSPSTQSDDLSTNDECHRGNNFAQF